jgi:predicted polyphosphate/ATP-dependent NAD kinase
MIQKNVGFLVNPIAGCGQLYNMKGSDYLSPKDCANSPSMQMAKVFTESSSDIDVTYYTASGSMGADAFGGPISERIRIVYSSPPITTRDDTIRLARILQDSGVSLIIFFGGDGTAVDLVDSHISVPVIGVPAGTKMFSSVFAISVDDAVTALKTFLMDDRITIVSSDVLKIDEREYSEGILNMSVYGQLNVPFSPVIVTSCKGEYPDTGIMDIAEYLQENMEPWVNYVVGPGSTCERIKELSGTTGSLSGFDLIRDGAMIKKDLSEQDIFDISNEPTKIVISPIGGQNFLLGRGNKQISYRILEKIGFDNIIVVSSPEKLSQISNLYVDFGIHKVRLPSFVRVLYGYGTFKLVPLRS